MSKAIFCNAVGHEINWRECYHSKKDPICQGCKYLKEKVEPSGQIRGSLEDYLEKQKETSTKEKTLKQLQQKAIDRRGHKNSPSPPFPIIPLEIPKDMERTKETTPGLPSISKKELQRELTPPGPYLTKSKLRSILEKELGTNVSEKIVKQTGDACEIYLWRQSRDRCGEGRRKPSSKVVKSLGKKLSFEEYLETNYILEKLNGALLKSKGRPQESARAMFLLDLCEIYRVVIGKMPEMPSIEKQKSGDYQTPFFNLANSLLKLLDRTKPHPPTLNSAIRKMVLS